MKSPDRWIQWKVRLAYGKLLSAVLFVFIELHWSYPYFVVFRVLSKCMILFT